jgi:hypothetical protein
MRSLEVIRVFVFKEFNFPDGRRLNGLKDIEAKYLRLHWREGDDLLGAERRAGSDGLPVSVLQNLQLELAHAVPIPFINHGARDGLRPVEVYFDPAAAGAKGGAPARAVVAIHHLVRVESAAVVDDQMWL